MWAIDNILQINLINLYTLSSLIIIVDIEVGTCAVFSFILNVVNVLCLNVNIQCLILKCMTDKTINPTE